MSINQIKGYGKKLGFDMRHVKETNDSVVFVHNKKEFVVKKSKLKEDFIRHVAHSLLNKNWKKSLGYVKPEILENLSSYCRCLLYLCTRGLDTDQLQTIRKLSWDGFEVDGDFKTVQVLERYLDCNFTTTQCIHLLDSASTFLEFLDSLHTSVMGVEINVVYDTQETTSDDDTPEETLRMLKASGGPLKLWAAEEYLYGTPQGPDKDVQKVIDVLSSEDLPKGVEILQTQVSVFDVKGTKRGQVTLERASQHVRLYRQFQNIQHVYI